MSTGDAVSRRIGMSDDERRSAAKRNALVLAVVVVVLYLGFIAWNMLRSAS